MRGGGVKEGGARKHPDTLTSMRNLASVYLNQGRFNEAEILGYAGDEFEEGGAQREASRHSDEHEQPGIDILGPGSIGRGGEVGGAGTVVGLRKEVHGKSHPDTQQLSTISQ